MVLRKSFYIRWSAGRSPRVHEVNPGRDPSELDPGPVAMATMGTNLGWGAESRSRELLVTAGNGKGLWCRAQPCGALGDGKLRSVGGVRSRAAAVEGEKRGARVV